MAEFNFGLQRILLPDFIFKTDVIIPANKFTIIGISNNRKGITP